MGQGTVCIMGELERAVVILLCGGTKRSQSRDIERRQSIFAGLEEPQRWMRNRF